MDIESAVYRASKGHYLGDNNDFFKSFYKKTEKIICAVFYILSKHTRTLETELIIKDAERTAQAVMDEAIAALECSESRSAEIIQSLMCRILALEAKLRMLHAARILDRDILHTILTETDGVLRFLRDFRQRTGVPLFDAVVAVPPKVTAQTPRRHATVVPNGGSIDTASVVVSPQSGIDRQQVILDVLRGRGPVSIKDISAVVKDCSEKTIQRTLNDLIKDGTVVREGDRRWSRYSVA